MFVTPPAPYPAIVEDSAEEKNSAEPEYIHPSMDKKRRNFHSLLRG